MAAVSMDPSDLTPFAKIDRAKATLMIEDAMALAALVAPCILTSDFPYEKAARAILRGAILRWNEAGTGALVQQSAGPYGQTVDNRQARKSMFWPTEIEQLQDLCRTAQASGIFSVDTVSTGQYHADICSINFGALYCSCGAVLTGSYPIYETEE